VEYSIQTRTGCARLVDTSRYVKSGDMSEFDTLFLKAIVDLMAQIDSDIQIDATTKTTSKLKFQYNH
jgi:hypothetical protein